MTWLTDSNGNKCSVEFFGTKEAAQKALDTLRDCENCMDCSDCSGCSRCSDCSGCSRCSDCSRKEGTGTAGDFNAPKVPFIPDIHKLIYEAVTAPKHHLEMSDWHTCKTTHCRGGWVVTLAGKEGKELEKFHGSLLAAQLIYDASDPSRQFNPGRFYDSNEDALEDMRKLAGK